MTSLTATALFLDGVTDSAQALREMLASALLTGTSPSGSTGIAARPGVRRGVGEPLQVNASSGMTVSVNPGVAFVQGTASTTSGMYTLVRDTSGTITLATSDPTNPRIDNIIARIVDNGDNTSTATIEPQTGTPAPSPTAPTLPANSLLLAQIAVAASTSSIVGGNITDQRVYTVATGGVLPVSSVNLGDAVSGPKDSYIHDLNRNVLRRVDSGGHVRIASTAAFGPVSTAVAGFTTFTIETPSTPLTQTLPISLDGGTQIQMEFTWDMFQCVTATLTDDILVVFYVGATAVRSMTIKPTTATQNNSGGSLFCYYTPPSGSVTCSIQLAGSGSSGDTFRMYNISLRITASFV